EQLRQVRLTDGEARRSRQRVEGAARFRALLAQLRDLAQARNALARIGRVLRPQLGEPDQLVDLARLLVVRLEHLGRAQAQILVVEQPLQARARALVTRLLAQHLAVLLERLVEAPEALVQPRDAHAQPVALLRRRARARPLGDPELFL